MEVTTTHAPGLLFLFTSLLQEPQTPDSLLFLSFALRLLLCPFLTHSPSSSDSWIPESVPQVLDTLTVNSKTSLYPNVFPKCSVHLLTGARGSCPQDAPQTPWRPHWPNATDPGEGRGCSLASTWHLEPFWTLGPWETHAHLSCVAALWGHV